MSDSEASKQRITEKLRIVLDQPNVTPDWRPFSGEGRRIYQPVVDIAVGPFAIGDERHVDDYNKMVHTFHQLIDTWAKEFIANWQTVIGDRYRDYHWILPPRSPSSHQDFVGRRANENARCFIAIEIENENSKKHLMGSIVNAGALGRIGLLVAWQEKVLRAAIRMRQYFDYLRSVKKRSFDMGGVMIITREQLAISLGAQA